LLDERADLLLDLRCGRRQLPPDADRHDDEADLDGGHDHQRHGHHPEEEARVVAHRFSFRASSNASRPRSTASRPFSTASRPSSTTSRPFSRPLSTTADRCSRWRWTNSRPFWLSSSARSRLSRAFSASLRRVSSPGAGAYSSATAAPAAAPIRNARNTLPELPCCAMWSPLLEDADSHVQVLARILPDLGKQIAQLNGRAVHVLIKLPVAQQLSGSPLAFGHPGRQRVQVPGH